MFDDIDNDFICLLLDIFIELLPFKIMTLLYIESVNWLTVAID